MRLPSTCGNTFCQVKLLAEVQSSCYHVMSLRKVWCASIAARVLRDKLMSLQTNLSGVVLQAGAALYPTQTAAFERKERKRNPIDRSHGLYLDTETNNIPGIEKNERNSDGFGLSRSPRHS